MVARPGQSSLGPARWSPLTFRLPVSTYRDRRMSARSKRVPGGSAMKKPTPRTPTYTRGATGSLHQGLPNEPHERIMWRERSPTCVRLGLDESRRQRPPRDQRLPRVPRAPRSATPSSRPRLGEQSSLGHGRCCGPASGATNRRWPWGWWRAPGTRARSSRRERRPPWPWGRRCRWFDGTCRVPAAADGSDAPMHGAAVVRPVRGWCLGWPGDSCGRRRRVRKA